MREYRLLPRRVSPAQIDMDRLVPALWARTAGPSRGPDQRLEEVFGCMLLHPERSAQHICPYFFDQVTWRLPASPARQRQNNLELNCFDSWANVREEEERMAERHQGRSSPERTPGVYLSQLCRQTGASMTTRAFLHLMYGYSG